MSRTIFTFVFTLFSAPLSASQIVTTAMVNPQHLNAAQLSLQAQEHLVTAQATLMHLVRKDFFYADKPEKVILYTNTIQQLEKDFFLVNNLESQCEISFLLGQAYFKGYKTDGHLQARAVNQQKAFFYLNFLIAQPDAQMTRQARAYSLLSNIYATGVKGWCGWKIPVDTTMAKKYANYALLLGTE